MRLGPLVVSLFAASRGLVAGTMLLSSLIIALIWIVTMTLVAEEKSHAVDNSISDSENIASIIAANLGDLLGRGELYASLSRPLLDAAPVIVFSSVQVRSSFWMG